MNLVNLIGRVDEELSLILINDEDHWLEISQPGYTVARLRVYCQERWIFTEAQWADLLETVELDN